MAKKVLFLSLVLLSLNSFSQRLFNNDKDFDLFRRFTRWGIQTDGTVYFPATYDNHNQYSFQSQYAIGYKFGLIYNINLSNHFGFKIGALAGQVPAINTYFILNKTDIGNDGYVHEKGASYSPIFNYSIPVLFEYRNFSIYRYTLSFAAGMQVERTSAATITEGYKNFYKTSVTNPGSWDMDLIFKAGWYFQFKPVMVQTSIVYKYRLNDQYVGAYEFNIPSQPSIKGSFVQRGDYVGLSFDFYFHKRAREVDMGCRANTQSAQVKKRQQRQQREKEKAQKRLEKIRKKKAKRMRKNAKKKGVF